MFSSRKVASLVAVVALAASGCSSSGSSPSASAAASQSSAPASVAASSAAASSAAPSSGAGCTVGVSWNNYQEERWAKWDEPAIKKALGTAKYIATDAKSKSEQQLSDVESLIAQKVNVIIILAQDGTAIEPAVQKATQAGVKVIAYDRLIEDASTLYITFDNVKVGHLQAQYVFAQKPTGNYVIIKGSPTDANANFLRQGMDEVIKSAVDSGAIKIVGETYTPNWDPPTAKTEMEQFLTKAGGKVDAVLSENDGMAGGVISALQDKGLAGTVPVSGQDGDQAALNRVALGTQTVDVWKDARLLGTTAGAAAIALCNGTAMDKITNVKPFTSPGKNTLNSILLDPDPITKDNLADVLDAGWITKDQLCQNVKAGSVKGC
jgi:D-xylose transport system substrate-binding protein